MKSTMFVQAETRSFFEPAFPPVQGSREEHYLCFYCRSRRYRQSLSLVNYLLLRGVLFGRLHGLHMALFLRKDLNGFRIFAFPLC